MSPMSSLLTKHWMKWTLSALFIVVLFNILFFSYEESKDMIFKTPLDRLEAAIKGKFSTTTSTESTPKKAVYRIYWDNREHGLLVVIRSESKSFDEHDPETQRILGLIAQSEEEGYIVHEIAPVVPGTGDEKSDLSSFKVKSDTLTSKRADYEDKISEENGKFSEKEVGTLTIIHDYSEYQTALRECLSNLMETVNDHKPNLAPINNDDHYRKSREENKFQNRNGRMPTYGGHWREAYTEEPVRTSEYLNYFFRLSTDEVNTLRKSHEDYVSAMKMTIPESLMKVGEAFDFMTGNGIVYLGGGRYNQLVLTSVSVLRSLGSVMPVEVIIPKREDFDIDLCDNILPKLNGRCKIMEEYVSVPMMQKIKGFQLKNVALLVSSFQNVLYLDVDNIPVKNPDFLFANEPFKSSRMVMWPDFWRRSTSPHFYDIAGIPVDLTFRARNSYFKNDPRGGVTDSGQISYHDLKGAIPEASSETGQMMIDKKRHFPTLVLSLYYNFWGPGYYYPLLTQGAAGEGDKETFIAAAHKLELPYYQVSEFNREFGPLNGNKKRHIFGIGQYDPIIDFAQARHSESTTSPLGEYATDDADSSRDNHDFHYYRVHSLMFLHANWPKHFLSEMFGGGNSGGRGPKHGDNRRRLYARDILHETGEVDVELRIMRHIKSWVCDTQIYLSNVPDPGSSERNGICKEVAAQIQFLMDG